MSRTLPCLFFVVPLLAACSENVFQPPPPPAVTVDYPTTKDVVDYVEFTGRTEALWTVNVPARVQGVLLSIDYSPGIEVAEGAPLFHIDPEPFAAARDAASATLKSSKAQSTLANTRAERMENSAAQGAISELQALEARAEADVTEAQVEVAEKQLAIQQLDVDYTKVLAPIKGRAMATRYSVGDLVGTLASEPLTTIYDDSSIYAWFSVPDRALLARLKAHPNVDRDEPVKVEMATEVDKDWPRTGYIDYVDPSVDVETGTVRIRALFDNKDEGLRAGLFVRVRIAAETLENALVIPEASIGSDQVGRYVYVVDDSGKVSRKNVTLGPSTGSDRVILSGLKVQDRIITKGLLRARPGAIVAPQGPDA
jgi:RND family efflux transporter MFP subunit